MTVTALVLAVLAFLIALRSRGELALLRERLERLEAHARGGDDPAELAEALRVQQGFLARLAAGERLDPEQVREGRCWSDVDPARAAELVEGGARVLDVRTPQETLAGVIPGALRIPVDELPGRLGELGRKSVPTLVYCAMGVRSAAACELLGREGFDAVYNLEAGYGTWAGPTERPGA